MRNVNEICNSYIKTVEQQAMLGLLKGFLWLKIHLMKTQYFYGCENTCAHMILTRKVIEKAMNMKLLNQKPNPAP